MIEEPKLEVIVDEFGHETYRMSRGGVLLDKEQAEYVAEKIKRLEDENKKLRELIDEIYPFARGYASEPWLEKRKDRMRELGIEVE